LKSKFQISILVSILAVIAAALMPLVVAGQVAPERPPSMGGALTYKWEAFALAGYTSLNQVNQSRYGLIGGRGGVTRDLGKHFGMTAIGSYYKPPTGKGGGGNPGDPSVYSALAGPEVRATLYGNFDGMLHGLIGIEHTGGDVIYNMSKRWALRASGDRIGAVFSLSNNTPQLDYSPHTHWNARGEFGVVFRF
jgi:hypothetical protein